MQAGPYLTTSKGRGPELSAPTRTVAVIVALFLVFTLALEMDLTIRIMRTSVCLRLTIVHPHAGHTWGEVSGERLHGKVLRKF